jgi:hypothetical protein
MSRNKKELYKNIYKDTYQANINNIISEDHYIYVLQTLNMKGFKTYHIENFDILTKNLDTKGLYDSFNISRLLYVRDLVYKKISDIALMFDDIGNIFSIKKKKMIKRIYDIQKLLKNKLKCIYAFKRGDIVIPITLDVSEYNSHNDDLPNNPNKITRHEKNYERERLEIDWIYYVKKDIIDRLHLLVKIHYTLEQLKFMNIELKLISDINSMPHNILCKYYMYVINTIENSIKYWIYLCKRYIDIEINYIECCDNMINGYPTLVKQSNINLNI